MVSTNLPEGTRLATFPTTYRVDLSEGLSLTSVAASDLQITRPDSTIVPADAVKLIDANTVEFTIGTAAAGDGTYQLSLASSSLTAVSGAPLETFDASFVFDTKGPLVVDSSIASGETVAAGLLTWTVTFNETLAITGLGPEDVTLSGVGPTRTSSTFAYDAGTSTLTATFLDVVEGDYTLSLLSSATAFRDVLGHLLDGNADGTPGDPFAISFKVDVTAIPLAASLMAIKPLGSLIYSTVQTGIFQGDNDLDTFTVALDAGQSATVLLRPLNASIQASGTTRSRQHVARYRTGRGGR